MKRISVFCGSSSGTDPLFMHVARKLGQRLAQHHIEVVYGGAKIGLMGAVADGALSEGGKVTGVLPKFLQHKEVAHPGLTDLHIVETMHERKIMMSELSDGVIALPGGYGTLEELFEMITWAQLGLHKKPIAILNPDNFFNPLLDMIQSMVDKGFLKEINQKMLLVDDDIDRLLQKMNNYKAPVVEKWLTKSTT